MRRREGEAGGRGGEENEVHYVALSSTGASREQLRMCEHASEKGVRASAYYNATAFRNGQTVATAFRNAPDGVWLVSESESEPYT